MDRNNPIEYLRGAGGELPGEAHPIVELTDEELRRVAGGAAALAGSTRTGSYNNSAPAMCCDGTKVCCNVNG